MKHNRRCQLNARFVRKTCTLGSFYSKDGGWAHELGVCGYWQLFLSAGPGRRVLVLLVLLVLVLVMLGASAGCCAWVLVGLRR